MRISLHEMMLWMAAAAACFSSWQWMEFGAGQVVIFVLLVLLLARLETFLPTPLVAVVAALLFGIGAVCLCVTM